MVQNAFANDRRPVELGRVPACDRRARAVAVFDHVRDAACGVVRPKRYELRMLCEEMFALSECNGMRLHGLNVGEGCVRAADEVLLDLNLNLVERHKRTRLH